MTTTNDTFAYTAQTFDGQPMSGTIDALDLDDAAKKLGRLQLRVMQLNPAKSAVRSKPPLGGADFAAFNQQLAHLTAAGLPIEQGLHLIAEDLKHGGLSQSVKDVSSELERGVPLGEAFKIHEKQFPPLYGTIVDAGVRAGNLPGALLNLGRHLELVSRLRMVIWRAVSYPLAVICGLFFVMIFIGRVILPQFKVVYSKWMIDLPAVTKLLLAMSDLVPAIIAAAVILVLGLPLIWSILRAMKWDRAVADLALPLPWIGSILRLNLIARWCDAVKLAVQSGMDLPASVQLACDVIGSPRLKRDGRKIVAQLQSGGQIEALQGRLSLLPPPVVAVIALSSMRNDLPESLETLAQMYQQQAEIRLPIVQNWLTPILLILVASFIGFVIIGLFMPIITLIQAFSSPHH